MELLNFFFFKKKTFSTQTTWTKYRSQMGKEFKQVESL